MFISTGNIQVRRFDGKRQVGPWLPLSDVDVPEWVAEMIADELEWHDDDSVPGGKVSRDGITWLWREKDHSQVC